MNQFKPPYFWRCSHLLQVYIFLIWYMMFIKFEELFTLSDSKKKINLSKPLLTHCHIFNVFVSCSCYLFIWTFEHFVFLLSLKCQHFYELFTLPEEPALLPILKTVIFTKYFGQTQPWQYFEQIYPFQTSATFVYDPLFHDFQIISYFKQIVTLNRWQREMLT